MGGKIILVSNAAGGVGRLTANALAQSGHTVHAAMGGIAGRNLSQARDVQAYALEQGVDLRPIDIDLGSEASVDVGVERIFEEQGRLDVVVHTFERMAMGPAEAFTPDQFAAFFDGSVLSAQRVNRAALPQMRRQRHGLLVWVSSSSVAGGSLPWLSPCMAAMAGLDALAVQYAREIVLWGIDTTIVVAGLFMRDTPLADAELSADGRRAAEYEAGPYGGTGRRVCDAFDRIAPLEADTGLVAGAIAGVVDMPAGERPFRLHVDPADDGGSVAFAVIDRMRDQMFARAGFGELLKPTADEPNPQPGRKDR